MHFKHILDKISAKMLKYLQKCQDLKGHLDGSGSSKDLDASGNARKKVSRINSKLSVYKICFLSILDGHESGKFLLH